MAEGLGEVVLGIRVDADQAIAGLNAYRQLAEQTGQQVTRALSVRPKSQNPDFKFAPPPPPLPDGYRQKLGQAEVGFAGLAASANNAATAAGGLRAAFGAVGSIFGSISAIDIGRRIAEAGLNAETAAVRLRALTRAYGENSEATAIAGNAAKALGISQTEAENGISALYASLRPTGIGLKDIETIFLSFNAAARNSGSTAQEASNAFIQLKQALSKGFLNGDELRSIGEQAPLVAQAIAETLGVSVGKLRDLGAEGKITTDVILKSLERIKGAQLTQLGEQLDTGRQKLKDFQIAAEELGKDISKVLAPIGSEFLALATDFTKALAGFNADPAKEKLQGIEAEVKRLQEVIELQKKLNLDTTDAKKQLEELEKKLGDLNLQDANVQIANQAYEQRLKLVKQIREEEDKSRFGGRAQKLTVETAVSGIAQDPTGLLGKAFANLPKLLPNSPFKDFFSSQDFSTRALEEGAKRVEEAFRKIASGDNLTGFSNSVQEGAKQINNLEADIQNLTKQKVELPIESKADIEQLDRQIKELEEKLRQSRLRFKLQIELEAVDKRLGEVGAKLAKDPQNANLLKEFNELTSTQLRYRVAIQDTNNQNSAQQKIAEQLGEAFGKLASDLTEAEVAFQGLAQKSLKGENVDPAAYAEAAKKYDELKQKLTKELGKTGISRIPEQLAQDLKALESEQLKLRVDSTAFQLVTERIALVREEIAGIEGRKALISAEFILRGLNDGTITNSINSVLTALDQLNNARATIDVSSPNLPILLDQLEVARERLGRLQSQNASQELSALARGLSTGESTGNLSNLERAISLLKEQQKQAAVGSTEYENINDKLFQLGSLQDKLNASLKATPTNVGNQLAQGFVNASDQIDEIQQQIKQLEQQKKVADKNQQEQRTATSPFGLDQSEDAFSGFQKGGGGSLKVIGTAFDKINFPGKLEDASAKAGVNLKQAAEDAANRLVAAGKNLRSAFEGNFKFLDAIRKNEVLSEAKSQISKASRFLDTKAVLGANTPEEILELGRAAKAINEASGELKSATKESSKASIAFLAEQSKGPKILPPVFAGGGRQSEEQKQIEQNLLKARQQLLQAQSNQATQPNQNNNLEFSPQKFTGDLATALRNILGAGGSREAGGIFQPPSTGQDGTQKRIGSVITKFVDGVAVVTQEFNGLGKTTQDLAGALEKPAAVDSAQQQLGEGGSSTEQIKLLSDSFGLLNTTLQATNTSLVSSTEAFDASVQALNKELSITASTFSSSFQPLVESNANLASQLSANASAVTALVQKNWTVNVQVNAANGSATVNNLTALA